MTVINSARNHPYNNSIRPSYMNHIANDENALNNNSITQSRNQDQQSQSLLMTTNESSNKINRNSSSNAILAQLKSISPNFKSIFVRPKHSKYVDSSSILNKSKNVAPNNTNSQSNIYSSINSKSNKNSMSSILNLLYNSSSSKLNDPNANSNENSNSNKNILTDPSKLINMLPSIQPKELRLNSSVDDLLRKFNTESMFFFETKLINA